MPNSVGGVSVSVRLDDADAQKELDRLKAKIDKLNQSLSEKKAQRDSIADEMGKAEIAAEKARQRVDQLKAALASASPADRVGIRADLAEATAEYKAQVKHMDQLNRQWLKLDAEITKGEGDLTVMTDQAADLTQQIAASDTVMAKLQRSAEDAGTRISKAFERVGKMIKRVFVLTTILRALRSLRTYLTDVLMSTPEFAEAFGQLKGALLTMVQPLMSIVIPALTRLVQILTLVVQSIGNVVAQLFGTTYSASQAAAKSLYDQAAAYKATGGAAKKASKDLAAFDQINRLSDESSSGGGSSSGSPLFNADITLMEDKLNAILRIVEAIGAALLAWKIGRALGMGLSEMVGLALLFLSTLEFIKGFLDAWNNGLNMDNLLRMLIALAGAALGAALAFGSVGAGIALIVGGIALLAVGFKDLIENGMNLTNTLAIIAGLLATGLGISLLTGSLIPALIAAIASVVVALVYLFDEGELFTEGFRDIFSGLAKFFKSIFAGDMEGAMAGLEQAFEGLKKVAQAVANAIKKAWQALLDWAGNTLGPKWRAFIEVIGRTVSEWVMHLKEGLHGLITFITGVFSGDWSKAWEGLKEIGRSAVNGLITILEGFLNAGIYVINGLIDLLNKINFDLKLPDWIPGVGGNSYHIGINIPHINAQVSIPRLAQGAVIPPNREFMAVLGDQKSGTNIEAPLETIVAAFRQAVREMGSNNDQRVEVRVYLDSREIQAGQQRLARVTGGR